MNPKNWIPRLRDLLLPEKPISILFGCYLEVLWLKPWILLILTTNSCHDQLHKFVFSAHWKSWVGAFLCNCN